MRRITYRFVLLIASAAIAPLLLYGIISIRNLQQGNGIDGPGRQQQAGQSGLRGDRPVHGRTTRACCAPLVSCCAASTWSSGSRRRCSRTSSAISRVPRDHVLRRRRPRHRHEPRRPDTPSRYRPPRPRQRRRLHRATRSRRGQPAAHDDCHPHRSGRAGAWLDRRRDCARGALAARSIACASARKATRCSSRTNCG